ncbi:MAG: CBS domain-containing protein [Synergistaceae bacterium]|jgi:hypothetical protein|nr:CBS domain-containing protein [Synergistaceae bacterium]
MLMVNQENTLSFALAKMIEMKEDYIVVVNAAGQLVGLLTRGDILRSVREPRNFNNALKNICNIHPKHVSLEHNDYIEQAQSIIEKNANIHAVLVVDSESRPVSFINKEDFQPTTNIKLDYPTSCRNFPRWASAPNPLLEKIISQNKEKYTIYADKYKDYREQLTRIPIEPSLSEDMSPHYHNSCLPPLDSSLLYIMISEFKPKKFIEVGSGHSTQFAKRAILDSSIRCELISIDPEPRVQIDSICDKIIRNGLETLDTSLFDELEAGDILFTDNSHRSFMNSDVTVVFTEILPRLKQGVVVHFHDIFLPFDYPLGWQRYFYNEQYLLASVLLNSKETAFDIIFPSFFASQDETIKNTLRQNIPEFKDNIYGASFWILKR